jgi:hypothetical protein
MRGVRASLVLIVLLAGCSGTGDTGETAAPTSTASLTTTQTAAAGEDEWQDMEEQIDELGAYQDAYALIGKEPAIPVTYLRATQSDLWTGPPAYAAAVPNSIAKYIDRFSPGVVREVESPHYMEAAVPDRIVQELGKVIAGS